MVATSLHTSFLMAPNSKPREKRRKSCFFPGGCCFGSFHDQELMNSEKNVSFVHRGDDGKTAKFGTGKKSRRSDKTVPVGDSTTLKKMNCSKEIRVVESGVEVKIDDHKLPVQSPAHQNSVNKDMFVEKRKSTDNSGRMLSSVKQSNKQNSTGQETWSGPIKLSHSVSMPLPPRKKEKVAAGGGVKEKQGKALKMGAGEFDPIVGALILTVTLVVMLVWGKVCAVICTAIWLYFIPRIIRPIHFNDFNDSYGMRIENGSDQIDLNSFEYKKKVVLRGFLERN